MLRAVFDYFSLRGLRLRTARSAVKAAIRFRPLILEQFELRELLAAVVLTPIRDNTLFSESDSLSNGAGEYLYTGASGFPGVRRALLKFDVASAIPAGAKIDSATLQMHVSIAAPDGETPQYQIRRVLADWGEGTSNAGSPGGRGAPATTNDATWAFRFFGTSNRWTTPGGDFGSTVIASIPIGAQDFYSWKDLAADVQSWLDAPANHFGWMIKAENENDSRTARRFDSRENSTPANRPMLTINYTVVDTNVPPTLDAIGDPPAILEDADAQTLNLTGITAGGESQALAVSAISNKTDLIPNPIVEYVSPNNAGRLQYRPAANQSGTAVITVTVRDAGTDGTLNNGDDGITSRSFSVTVNPVNDPPTLDAIAEPAAILEDAGQQTVNLSGILAGGGEAQALAVSVVSSNPGLIPNPTPVYTSPNTTGSLRYTPVADASGNATITVTVRDAGLDIIPNNGDDATVSQSFVVRVNAVNDAPTLDAIGNATTTEDAEEQTIGLSGIRAGGGETQALIVTAESSNPTLLPSPTVTYTSPGESGLLRYRPNADRSGTAQITVTVRDAGLNGTPGDGDDGVSQRTFSITVDAANDAPTLDPIGDPAPIDEDGPLQTVNLAGISAGPLEQQTLQVTAASSDVSLIPTPTVSYNSPSATGSISYQAVANSHGSATITVTIRDAGLDGQLGNEDDGTVSRSFAVTVNPINDPPTLNDVPDPTAIVQDSGEQTINLSGISAGLGDVQPVTLIVSWDNTDLIPSIQAEYVSPETTGRIRYTPAPGMNGSAIFTVTVRDPGTDNIPNNGDDLSVSKTFRVQVNAPGVVNQPPSFEGGVDRTATDQDGPVTAPGWATQISPGPGEDVQTVDFLVSNDDNSLFSVQPDVDPTTGTLTFTPRPNAHGTALITIQLKDNGGTAGGGVDTSPPQTFEITILKPKRWHNSARALDVADATGSGVDNQVVAGDALAIINYINAFGSGAVPENADFGPPYLDTTDSTGGPTGDNFVVAGDALAVINFINAFGSGLPGPAGEPFSDSAESSIDSDLVAAIMADPEWLQPQRRRR